MSFQAQTYRVMIASPSDLSEERQVVADAIGEWNAEHAVAESVVLLPVRWETHARPVTGARPQHAINDQLVSHSDLLIGLFWTRLGSNTGVADSGTVEEIDQFVAAKKPAMLYFSRRPIDPNKIDITQHQKLRAFQEASLIRQHPVLAFGKLGDRLRAPVPDLIMQRVTTGLYYDLRGGGTRLQTEVAGRFETYCKDYIANIAPRFNVLPEYRYRGPAKGNDYDSPDILIEDAEALAVVIECKSTKLTFAAQFAEQPQQQAKTAYEEIGKGIFQVWRYFAHCRRGLTGRELTAETCGMVLTLDAWLILSPALRDYVLGIAIALADADGNILPEDRRAVTIGAIQDFEHVLSDYDEDGILSTLKAAAQVQYRGWMLPNVAQDVGIKKVPRKPFPFDIRELLPWWKTLHSAQEQMEEVQ